MKRNDFIMKRPGGGMEACTVAWPSLQIYVLTGVNDDSLPVRGFASIPPGDRRDLGPKPFFVLVMYL
jgi:hypothetical protein